MHQGEPQSDEGSSPWGGCAGSCREAGCPCLQQRQPEPTGPPAPWVPCPGPPAYLLASQTPGEQATAVRAGPGAPLLRLHPLAGLSRLRWVHGSSTPVLAPQRRVTQPRAVVCVQLWPVHSPAMTITCFTAAHHCLALTTASPAALIYRLTSRTAAGQPSPGAWRARLKVCYLSADLCDRVRADAWQMQTCAQAENIVVQAEQQ